MYVNAGGELDDDKVDLVEGAVCGRPGGTTVQNKQKRPVSVIVIPRLHSVGLDRPTEMDSTFHQCDVTLYELSRDHQ